MSRTNNGLLNVVLVEIFVHVAVAKMEESNQRKPAEKHASNRMETGKNGGYFCGNKRGRQTTTRHARKRLEECFQVFNCEIRTRKMSVGHTVAYCGRLPLNQEKNSGRMSVREKIAIFSKFYWITISTVATKIDN